MSVRWCDPTQTLVSVVGSSRVGRAEPSPDSSGICTPVQVAVTQNSSVLLLSGDQLQLQRSIGTHVPLMTSLRLPGIEPAGLGPVSAVGLSPGGDMLAALRAGDVLRKDANAARTLNRQDAGGRHVAAKVGQQRGAARVCA